MTDVRYYAEARSQARTDAPTEQASFGLVNWVGAGCSLALVAGLVTWSVQLTLRDVAEVPVIAALQEPMRVAPENPGGMQAAYQGLSVNEIKAGGAAAPVADRVVLAPPPVDLEPVIQERVAPEPVATIVQTSASAPTDAPVEAPQEYASLNVASLASELSAAVSTTPEADVIPASVPGIARSVRPAPRPGNVRRAASAVAVQRASVDADAGSVTPGARLVQLGAFDTPEQAMEAWERLEGRFGDYMVGKKRLVQSAVSGGRNFYRLRVVGFDDATAARQFCSAFLERNAACIPVTAK
mgnify:CR=1 FL=1